MIDRYIGSKHLKTLLWGAAAVACAAWASALVAATISRADQALLEDMSHRSFQCFWEQSDPNTGITRDKARLDGQPSDSSARDVGSTGATGFGVTALCIAAERGWIPRDKAREIGRASCRERV